MSAYINVVVNSFSGALIAVFSVFALIDFDIFNVLT